MSYDPSGVSPVLSSVEEPATLVEVPQRQRMLMGMAETIAKHGYRGATITEVVRYARVSKRTFYEEFGDKESCFLELYDQTRDHLEQLMVERSSQSDRWREQIALGARAYYQALTVSPLLTRAFFIEIGTLSERATRHRRQAFDQFALLLCDLVDQARRENPEIPSRPLTPVMSTALMGGMTEVMIAAIEKDEMADRIDELVEVCTDLIATVVTGQFPPGQEPA